MGVPIKRVMYEIESGGGTGFMPDPLREEGTTLFVERRKTALRPETYSIDSLYEYDFHTRFGPSEFSHARMFCSFELSLAAIEILSKLWCEGSTSCVHSVLRDWMGESAEPDSYILYTNYLELAGESELNERIKDYLRGSLTFDELRRFLYKMRTDEMERTGSLVSEDATAVILEHLLGAYEHDRDSLGRWKARTLFKRNLAMKLIEGDE